MARSSHDRERRCRRTTCDPRDHAHDPVPESQGGHRRPVSDGGDRAAQADIERRPGRDYWRSR